MNTSILTQPNKKAKPGNDASGMDQLIHDVLFKGEQPTLNSKRIARPAANIIDREKEIILELAVPGISKKDIQLKLKKMQLIVSAHASEEEAEQTAKFLRKGFDFKHFERIFTLSEEIDTGHIEAQYNHGILRITLPVKEDFGPKQIQVK